ncbi:MAG: hypothetical protein MK096_14300 [Oleiphilaceae bacterium]|nr:hypothetical protein [Oleiphilaceae bacterium]
MGELRRIDKCPLDQSSNQKCCGDGPALGKRNDELASIAKAFDNMADRTQALIETQRLLLADLSHEMRTPIARLELALENQKNGKSDHFDTAQKNLEDLRRLASDALTLA